MSWRKCVVERCNLNGTPERLMCFPKDEDAKRVWLHRLERDDLISSEHISHYRVCSAHFGPGMWTKGGRRLTSCAIPYWEKDVIANGGSIPNQSPTLDRLEDRQRVDEAKTDQLSSTSNASISFYDLNDLHKLNGDYENNNNNTKNMISKKVTKISQKKKTKKHLKKKIEDPIVPLQSLFLPRKKTIKPIPGKPDNQSREMFAESLQVLQNTISDFIKYESNSDKSQNNFGAYLDSELELLDPQTLYVAKFHINQVLFEASSGRYKNVMIKTNRNSDFNKFDTSSERVHNQIQGSATTLSTRLASVNDSVMPTISTIPTRLTTLSDAVIPTSTLLKEPTVAFPARWQNINKISNSVNKYHAMSTLPIPAVISKVPSITISARNGNSQQLTMPGVRQVSVVPVQHPVLRSRLVQGISSIPSSAIWK